MSASLFQPPGELSPAEALHLSQQAPSVLKSNPASIRSAPLLALFSAKDTPDLWTKYENLLLSCLRTGDEPSARQCLERIANRFGADNERVMALIGLVKEAECQNDRALDEVLKEYNKILTNNNTNIPIAKRRIALLRSIGRTSDAVSSLNTLLDFSPTDSEAWSELSDIYLGQGMYAQAIFALEEVLVLAPNAWNMHARLGEVLYMAATTTQAAESPAQKYLAEALKRFCRSIELCDDYLRGYYGLKLVTSHILKTPPKPSKQSDEDRFSLPDDAKLKALDEMATTKLAEIIRRNSAGEGGWKGYSKSEIEAARKLLDQDNNRVR
ncbi:hypothetical protein MKZ38_007012 [Zalerion maritima]|uniref:ER membrane protein complex subunit 2 n=1 Tax=Zalerion maritima TaxID=339359 RepID=A0AAD5RVU4_9PEZI|nr:hypothetical protein MKZ38_007012 [Zalerion maritima]